MKLRKKFKLNTKLIQRLIRYYNHILHITHYTLYITYYVLHIIYYNIWMHMHIYTCTHTHVHTNVHKPAQSFFTCTGGKQYNRTSSDVM